MSNLMGRFKLSDMTAAFPKRIELGERVVGFGLGRTSYLFNQHHWHLVDKVFETSAMGEHYQEYLKQLPREKEKKMFKGLLINQAVMIMLDLLDNPNVYGDQMQVATLYTMSIWKTTFMRKYAGSARNGKLEHMEPIGVSMPRFDFTKEEMQRGSDLIFDVIHGRAESLLEKWRKCDYYRENIARH